MISTLRYGAASAVSFEIPPEVLLAECAAPRGTPIHDTAVEVARALETPLHFPPFSQAVVPGDKVAVALDYGVPQSAAIVGAVVRALLAGGVTPADISVLRAVGDASQTSGDPLAGLPADVASQIHISLHDPADRANLGYLASSHEGKPIYVNRLIVEADLVVPIGCLRLEEALGYHGASATVYPTFSDSKSLERFRSPHAESSPVQHKRLCKEADEVSWLLGVLFTVQIVPGAGEEILHVLAGDVNAVFEQGKKLCDEAWNYSAPRRASLVVAAVEGDHGQQTWENVARALAAASRAVSDDGAIAICTELDVAPGPAMQRIAGADDLREALREIVKERPADALSATQLVQALERGKVYLLSRLDENVVEELGVAPVSSAEQIARLASRHDSCILLANAQHARVTPMDETST